ncbi:MAG: helix-turn-helix domain-containing protein [Bacilli bacterium]
MKKTTTELGKVIAAAREKVGISQRELSRRANMDCAEISRIEAGKRLKPNVLYLKGIAETLNLSMVDLMKLAGYNDIEINWGQDFTDRRSTKDYQNQIQEFRNFYFDVLGYIDDRRKVDFSIKGGIADLIDKLELAKISNKEISNDEILERLKELIPMIRPNLEKFDKSKYPAFDKGVFPKMEIKSNVKYNSITGKIIDKEE